jgi:hypothetical protein
MPSPFGGWIGADIFPSDIAVLKTYGAAPYANALKKLEKDIKDKQASVNEKIGVKVNTSSSCFNPFEPPRSSHAPRNPTPVSHLHTSGMSPPTDNAWPRNSHYRSLVAQRLFRMRRMPTRANMSSTSNRLPSSWST